MSRRRASFAARVSLLIAVSVVAAGAGSSLYAYRNQAAITSASAAIPGKIQAVAPPPLSVKRTYFGLFKRGVPASYQPVTDFTRTTGQRPDIVLYYSGWGDPFQARFAGWAAGHHAIPFVQMEPRMVAMTSIIAGYSDGYLRAYARAVRAYGRRVIISFAPEANGNWYGWGWTHTPPRIWAEAWRHVVTVFRQQGAGNVTWLWTVSRDADGTGPLKDYWPGASYVNWVGIDGYYFEGSQSFRGLFGPAIHAVRALTRDPVFLSEVGVGQVAGRASKISGLFAGIRENHLLGLLWFDVAQHGGFYHQDWRLEGHPAAMAAFRRGLASMPMWRQKHLTVAERVATRAGRGLPGAWAPGR